MITINTTIRTLVRLSPKTVLGNIYVTKMTLHYVKSALTLTLIDLNIHTIIQPNVSHIFYCFFLISIIRWRSFHLFQHPLSVIRLPRHSCVCVCVFFFFSYLIFSVFLSLHRSIYLFLQRTQHESTRDAGELCPNIN